MYSIQFLQSATKSLKKLDKKVSQQIIDRIRWLAENIQSTKLYPLKGELSGLYKIREGSYRIIFQTLHKEKIIIIHSIGHRRDIYKER